MSSDKDNREIALIHRYNLKKILYQDKKSLTKLSILTI